MDGLTMALLISIGLILGSFLLVSVFLKLQSFFRELDYINKEIRRNTGSKRKYWISQKKKLWRKLLPFGRK